MLASKSNSARLPASKDALGAGSEVKVIGDDLYYYGHRVVLSDQLADASASTSGDPVAVAGHLDAIDLGVRRDLTVVSNSQNENDVTVYNVSWRGGFSISASENLSKMVLA
ncbi:MAG: hypothetical protein ACPGLY_25415 [Rubripirellula sp.]